MTDTMLLAFADTPSHASCDAGEGKSVPSERKKASFLDFIPRSTALKRVKGLKERRTESQ